MFILKEAWGSVARHKVLSIVSVTTTVVVTAATLMGLAIVQADTTARTTAYDAQRVNAIISLDKAKIEKKNKTASIDWSNYELSWEQYSTYAEAAGVTINAYYYETSDAKLADGVKAVTGSSDSTGSKARGEISIVGTSSKAATQSLPDSGFTLVSGKTVDYSATAVSDKAVISQAFAQANDYKVGSTFNILNPSDAKKTIKLTVSGIYKNHAGGSGVSTTYSDARNANNAVYVSSYTFMGNGFYSATKPGSVGHDLRIVFELSNPKDYNTFVKKARAAGLSSNYIISSPTLAAYEAKTSSLATLAKAVKIALIVVCSLGVIILLTCLVLAWMRRNEDIGMLIGIGVGRARIAWRYTVELLMITVPGVLIGFAIGTGLSFAIAGTLPASDVVRSTPDLALIERVALGAAAFWVICLIAAIIRVALFRMNTLLDPVTYGTDSGSTDSDNAGSDGTGSSSEATIGDEHASASADSTTTKGDTASSTETDKEEVSA
ncbi:ABC transporter permease [Bifidobacterium aquikefiricola]|uniref:ABC transporter permease n=1 Tax=Bifidobacterium aquikefiricola TaxID=3059038 RepID=A0AB39U5U4_9BIFI